MEELLCVLGLTKDDLLEKHLNVEGTTGYYCDFCEGPCIGNYYQIKTVYENLCNACYHQIDVTDLTMCKFKKSNADNNDFFDEMMSNFEKINIGTFGTQCNLCKQNKCNVYKMLVKCINACIKCQNELNLSIEYCNLRHPPEYDDNLSYKYNIISIKKLNDKKFIYIVEENNFNKNMEDIHYYLKYYNNGNIIVDHEIQTYNPYFGVWNIAIDIDNDNIITLSYHEKHKPCVIKLKPNGDNHKIYLKSKPGTSYRSYNEKVKWHEIGDIIEFKVGDKIRENKEYFG